MGKLDTQDAAQLIRTLSVVFLSLVSADAESLSITTEFFYLFREYMFVFGSTWKFSVRIGKLQNLK